MSTVVILLCVSQYAWADVQQPPPEANQTVQISAPLSAPLSARRAGDLASKTDTELTELTAQWASLNPSQRRALLAEVRGRMVANQKARPPGMTRSTGVRVRVQRQYGRVVRRQSDGSVVVETRVVQQVRPQSIDGVPQARVTFGIGFEQRSKSRPATQPDTSSAVTPPLRRPPQLTQPAQPGPGVTVSQQSAPSEP